MTKFALLVEYEGTRYHGFQIQPEAPTVQGKLEQALVQLTGMRTSTVGASRTDAGVHARGQVVTVEIPASFSPQSFLRALNSHLPRDIAVHSCSQVADDFHPRRQAISRKYRYTILNTPMPSPFERMYTHFVFKPLDVEAMNQACGILIGQHDFASFTTPRYAGRNTTRTVFQVHVQRNGGLVFFHITANSFLPQQVRRTMGPLIKVGLGQMTVQDFWQLARAKTPGLATPVASARGLCLMRIEYPNLEFGNGQSENIQYQSIGYQATMACC